MVTEKLARFVVETPLEKIPASVLDGARAALIAPADVAADLAAIELWGEQE